MAILENKIKLKIRGKNFFIPILFIIIKQHSNNLICHIQAFLNERLNLFKTKISSYAKSSQAVNNIPILVLLCVLTLDIQFNEVYIHLTDWLERSKFFIISVKICI